MAAKPTSSSDRKKNTSPRETATPAANAANGTEPVIYPGQNFIHPFLADFPVRDSWANFAPSFLTAKPQPLADLFQQTVEQPIDFEPLRRMLVPGDRVCIIQEESNYAETLKERMTTFLNSLQIETGDIHWLKPTPLTTQEKTDGEETQPPSPADFAYLASTKAGQRVYLRREIVDADQVIIIGSRGYDIVTGHKSGVTLLFPGCSNRDTQDGFIRQFKGDVVGDVDWPNLDAANEVAWLLGLPFFIDVWADSRDVVHGMQSGVVASGGKRQSQFLAQSTIRLPRQVGACLLQWQTGEPGLTAITQALLHAVCTLPKAVPVVILAELETSEREALSQLSRRQGKNGLPATWVNLWPKTFQGRRIYWASEDTHMHEILENRTNLQVTPIASAAQLQRLLSEMEAVIHVWEGHLAHWQRD